MFDITQDAEADRRLLDIAARADIQEAIRQGLDDVAKRRTYCARDAFDQIRKLHDIPRFIHGQRHRGGNS